MAPLAGDTLGQKHQYYNKLVKEAVAKQQAIDPTLSEEDDVQNLLKIDVACKTKNVKFLLEILKSEDSLYVSKAIKNSKWLITDKQLSHVVNPEYIYTELCPKMTSKAFNKLMLSIRLNLRDEKRVEAFYKYIAEKNRADSFKWLQHCSVPFIETEIKKHGDEVSSIILRRLVEKSISIFAIFMKTSSYKRYQLMEDTVFLACIDTEKYLDTIEAMGSRIHVQFTSKATSIFMKKCPNRILDKFPYYAGHIHIPTFVKHLKAKQDIQSFLLKQAENEDLVWFFNYRYMEHFIKYMPKDQKFEFVKKCFINKEVFKQKDDDCVAFCHQSALKCMKSSQQVDNNSYQWYKFAPFDEGFTDLKKMIRTESSPAIRNQILQVLLYCAGRNMNNVRTVLKFFHEKHINEPFKFKIQFVNMFLSQTNSHEFDIETWSLLNQLFQSMEVYVESDNNTKACIKAILVRHVVRGEGVPEIIREKFTFDTLKQYQNKLKKQEDKDALFSYLDDYLVAKHVAQKSTTQSELGEAITLYESHLNLLKDWNKELKDHPFLINRLKNLITIKRANSWNTEMKSIYNFNKAWKRVLFNESISLCPIEAVCVNALKHDPSLLERQKSELETMMKNDALSLAGMLSKVRIYWSDTLAEEWKTSYLDRLEKPGGHKALVTGLFTLLPQKQLNDVAQKYAPAEAKIDWNNVDELTISLQKQIAKYLSKARLLTPLETVLLFAKGDYLQFVVPSLNSILSQLSANKIRKYLPILLDSPVSLQKYGVRYAFSKLSSQELKPILTDIWKSTKNSSIRAVLFTHTHTLLSKEKNILHVQDIWELLNMFIENLSTEEDKLIYKKLGDITDIPISIRPAVFMKSYTFLKSLPAKANCESIINNLRYTSAQVMERLDDDFVVNVMMENIDEKFTKSTDNMYENGRIVASFMLFCKDEAATTRRYEKFLAPLLDRNLPLWNHVHDNTYYVKANLQEILTKLVYYIDEYCLENKMNVPVKSYQDILSKLEAALSPQQEYVFLTAWKLSVEFLKAVDEHKDVLYKFSEETSEETDSDNQPKKYAEMHAQIAPLFAKFCIQQLKSDLNRFYPSVYILFAKAFNQLFDVFLVHRIIGTNDCLEYLKTILKSSNEREVYLVVYRVLKRYVNSIYEDDDKKKMQEVRKILYMHPSEELKMHYYQLFNEQPDIDIEK